MCFVVFDQRNGLSEQFYSPCQQKPGDGTRSIEYAATYKLLDLGYGPAQSHPQIFLLTLIVDTLEVSQLVVQSC